MKKTMLAFIFLLTAHLAFVQAAVDIFDPLYDDLNIWEDIGLINDAPALRPFPLQEIKRLLTIVIARGDLQQQKNAQQHYDRFFKRPVHFGVHAGYALKAMPAEHEFYIFPSLRLNFSINKILSVSGDAGLFITNKLQGTELYPLFRYTDKDFENDEVRLGSLYALLAINSGLAIGTPEYYFTAGISRTSFGAFHDTGIFINPQAQHHGQFVLTINKEKWNYTQALFLLTATDNMGIGRNPNKFLAFHALDFRPLPWISVGIVDSVVYGGRFEPIYLLPFSAFFVSQGLYGFPDNSLIGLNFSIKPIAGLRIDLAVNTDDMGFNEIVKFKKDAKARMAAETGISYTMPKTHWFTSVDLNYTIVTPYTFTHFQGKDSKEQNYQNYTHKGIPFATNLPPNSDRINFKLRFKPLDWLNIELSNSFVRHANISESIDDLKVLKAYLKDKYTTDGSILNHHAVYTDSGIEYIFNYMTPFLKQSTIQYVNQLGLDFSLRRPLSKAGGYVIFKFGYVFEANINPGVLRDIYTPPASAPADDAAYRKIADEQLAAWREQAKGKLLNHFLRFAIDISY